MAAIGCPVQTEKLIRRESRDLDRVTSVRVGQPQAALPADLADDRQPAAIGGMTECEGAPGCELGDAHAWAAVERLTKHAVGAVRGVGVQQRASVAAPFWDGGPRGQTN